MDCKDISELISNSVDTEEVIEMYGMQLTPSGFVKCPFHGTDRTASLKVYRGKKGWHCYGCHRGGSPIDFVKEYEGINFFEASQRINQWFGLGLDIDTYPSIEQERELAKRKLDQQKKKADWEDRYEKAWDDYLKLTSVQLIYESAIRNYTPANADSFTDAYANAVKWLPTIYDELDEVSEVIRQLRKEKYAI